MSAFEGKGDKRTGERFVAPATGEALSVIGKIGGLVYDPAGESADALVSGQHRRPANKVRLAGRHVPLGWKHAAQPALGKRVMDEQRSSKRTAGALKGGGQCQADAIEATPC